MNVFIKEKDSGNYYNLFDVSTVNISFREVSEEKHAIDIHIFNDTFHVYASRYSTEEDYRDLQRSFKTSDAIDIYCDSVHAMPVTR